jgi:hypothetical protein
VSAPGILIVGEVSREEEEKFIKEQFVMED